MMILPMVFLFYVIDPNSAIPTELCKVAEMEISEESGTIAIGGYFDFVADGTELYILDMTACRVEMIDFGGRLGSGFGMKGQGPGEFQQPIGIECDGQKLYVLDAAKRSVDVFSKQGEFEDSHKILSGMPQAFAIAGEQIVLAAQYVKMEASVGRLQRKVLLLKEDFRKSQVLFEGRSLSQIEMIESPSLGFFFLACSASGWVAVGRADTEDCGVLLVRTGREQRSIKTFATIPKSNGRIEREQEEIDAMSRQIALSSPQHANLAIKIETIRCPVEGVSFDQSERIWVMVDKNDSDKMQGFDVFGIDGQYFGRRFVNHADVSRFKICGNRVVCVSQDDDSVIKVSVSEPLD